MAFLKESQNAPPGFFACEAAGLTWLSVRGGPRVVRVLDVSATHLELERLEPVAPSREAARSFGEALARLHDAGADAFGASPKGWCGDGFFGPLDQPLPMVSGRYERWGAFYADCRMSQVRDLLTLRTRLSPQLAADLDRLIAALRDGTWDEEPPARVHGDLWSGNVMWTSDGVVLIDPAAHGGHRMTDLSMLELFGLPFLADVRAGYASAHPLPNPWPDAVELHQLYPLGMHAVLFGGEYLPRFARLVGACVEKHG